MYQRNAVPMIRGGSQSRFREDRVEHRNRIAVAEVGDRVRLHIVVEVSQDVGEVVTGLVDKGVGDDVQSIPLCGSTERFRVFLTTR